MNWRTEPNRCDYCDNAIDEIDIFCRFCGVEQATGINFKDKTATLFNSIAHGDDKHRLWLKAAIEAHFGLSEHQP